MIHILTFVLLMAEQRLTLAFITVDDPRDKRAWSGTNYFLMRTLQEYCGEVEALGPYTPQPQKFIAQVVNELSLRLFGRRYDYRHSALFRRALGRYFSRKLKAGKYDAVIVSASNAAAAGLRTDLPVIYINDRSIPGAVGYHKILKQLWGFSLRQSVETDKLAISRSMHTVFCSQWAADSAALHKGVDLSRVRVIPFGANIENEPGPPAAMPFPPQQIKLLFAGVNWHDKGGPVALQALEYLLAQGISAELVVCGCTPPVQHPNMRVKGFLNKNIPAEFEELLHEFRTAHFFLLPTRFEAYGLVFCESAAFGLPVLAPATGGIPTIVHHGETGFLLPPDAHGQAYAEKILELIHQPERWQQMRTQARARYEEVLNWKSFAQGLRPLLTSRG
ncbi:MAG: glycosyltransferase family 4 protein [Bacteroidia bacterium]|nr:glycosyltransferase family 4 protein [Bacteroidia bacterium]